MKRIIEYEIIDHGLEHDQYFRGCGVSFTLWDDCFTGNGDNLRLALEDATDQMYSDPDIDSKSQASNYLEKEIACIKNIPETEYSENIYHYASIRVKYEIV